jgi:hypothetical protein
MFAAQLHPRIINTIIGFVLGQGVEILLQNRAIMANKRDGVGIYNHKLVTYARASKTEQFTEKLWNSIFFEIIVHVV